jgi:hypothetical protein
MFVLLSQFHSELIVAKVCTRIISPVEFMRMIAQKWMLTIVTCLAIEITDIELKL